jgi:aminoglycoside 3-N-acetyltransferase
MNASDITQQQITSDITAMGVRPGDLLLVHSSLKSLGQVIGGAEAAARALVDVVGPTGTVFVPTFNFAKFPWDVKTTPSAVGAITEAFRHLPSAKRSLQSTHPVSAIGPRADEILADHEKTHPFAVNSPLGKLWKLNAWVLLLGCGHRSSSMIHIAEEAEDVPYLYRVRQQTLLLPDGTSKQIDVRRPGVSNGFYKIDGPLRSAGKILDGKVGQADSMLMCAADIVETARQMLRKDLTALLCDDPMCEVCMDSRRLIAQAKPHP